MNGLFYSRTYLRGSCLCGCAHYVPIQNFVYYGRHSRTPLHLHYTLAALSGSKLLLSEAFASCGGRAANNARLSTSSGTSLSDHKMSRSARNLSFLGIQNYFTGLERHVQKCNNNLRGVHRAQFSISCASQGSAQVSLQKPKELDLPAEIYGSSAPLPPSQRSDWRLRATSRTKRTQLLDARGHRRYIRRVAPPYMQVQPGEQFHEEIQAYNEQFVALLKLVVVFNLWFTVSYPCWTLSKPRMSLF
jgi:hypothetical protein